MMECQKNPLPAALTEDHRKKLYDAVDLAWLLLYNNSQLSELALGEFLLDLHDNMVTVVNASSAPQIKFRLYSGTVFLQQTLLVFHVSAATKSVLRS